MLKHLPKLLLAVRNPFGTQSVRFRYLDENYRDQTLALAIRLYARKEPMGAALGLTEDEIRPLMTAVIDISIRERMGLVALDAASDQVVAFFCSKDFTTPLPITGALSPKLDPLLDVLDKIETDFKNRYQPKKGEVGHWFMIGVSTSHLNGSRWSKRFWGGQLSLQVVKQVRSHCRLMGFRKYFTECTTEKTARLMYLVTKNPEVTLAIDYASYVDPKTGQRPFASLKGDCQGFVCEL